MIIPMWIIDTAPLVASLIGLIILFMYWKKLTIKIDNKFFLLILFLLFGFHSLGNALEYSGITSALDPYGDILQILHPLFWGFLLYTLVQEIIEIDRDKAEKNLLNKTKTLERFAKIAVGREKKMIELKKEIRKSKKQKR